MTTDGGGGEISRTARSVAMIRAQFSRPASLDGDAVIDRRLADALVPDGPPPRGALTEYLRSRTRFFDYHVMWALMTGVRQIVLVGAGYDLRALRFRTPGLRFFELDRTATQADKRRRLADLAAADGDVTFVSIDLAAEPVSDALATAGHDAASPSLFICEGLLLYLDAETVRALLLGLRAQAAAGSRLAMTVELGEPDAQRQRLHAYLRQVGEPPQSTWSPEAWHALLAATGWHVDEPGTRLMSAVPAATTEPAPAIEARP